MVIKPIKNTLSNHYCLNYFKLLNRKISVIVIRVRWMFNDLEEYFLFSEGTIIYKQESIYSGFETN